MDRCQPRSSVSSTPYRTKRPPPVRTGAGCYRPPVPLNREYIGKSYPGARVYEVGREKIREFAEAIGDKNPAYVDPEAANALGHPDVIAPPTFATVITLQAGGQAVFDPELGLDYSLVVHGE